MSLPVEAVIFDVDGVLIDSPHEQAWREALDELMAGPWAALRGRTSWVPGAFSSRVYRNVVSGRSRQAGARGALEFFSVPEAAERAVEFAARKQERLLAAIEAGAVAAFDDGVRLVWALREAGVVLAAASSSKNAPRLLRAVEVGGGTLAELFAVDVSGRDFVRGKPDPEIFLTAARESGVPAERCVVVEDAVAGVRAAKAAGMGAVGVARAGDAAALSAAGADVVVASLDEVDVSALLSGRATSSR